MGKLSKNIESCCTHDIDKIKVGDILAYDKDNNTFIFKVTKNVDGIIYYNKVYNIRAQQMYVCNNENLVVLYDEVPLLYYATQQQCELYSHPEIDYIINTLKCWEQTFTNIVLHYWFEYDTQYHIITIEPYELHKSYGFINCENKLYEDLDKKYRVIDLLISEPKHSLEPINELYKTVK